MTDLFIACKMFCINYSRHTCRNVSGIGALGAGQRRYIVFFFFFFLYKTNSNLVLTCSRIELLSKQSASYLMRTNLKLSLSLSLSLCLSLSLSLSLSIRMALLKRSSRWERRSKMKVFCRKSTFLGPFFSTEKDGKLHVFSCITSCARAHVCNCLYSEKRRAA